MLIGLTGFARSGKDSVGNMLVERHGFERRAFADPMRAALLALDPIVDAESGNDCPWQLSDELDYWLGDWDKLKASSVGSEVRRLLQRLGTEAGRDIHGEDVWVHALFNKPVVADTVITDVRFVNEAEAVVAHGGVVVRVIRPGVYAANGHASETEQLMIRPVWQLYNGGSLDELSGDVDDLVSALGEPSA